MKLRLIALPAALAALALVGSGAEAASAPVKPQIVDAAGDAVGSQASYDITGVTFAVTKTAVKSIKVVKGKKVTVTTYVPKDFQVTMALAGDAKVQPGVSYQIGVDTGCGHMFIYAYTSVFAAGGTDSSMQVGLCGPDDPTATDGNAGLTFDHTITATGKSIVWSMPYKTLPKEMAIGKGWDSPVAYTALTEPVIGYTTADFVEETAIDYATGDGFKLA